METATYWTKAIAELSSIIKTCKPQHRNEYIRALRYAQIKLNKLRREAGVYLQRN